MNAAFAVRAFANGAFADCVFVTTITFADRAANTAFADPAFAKASLTDCVPSIRELMLIENEILVT